MDGDLITLTLAGTDYPIKRLTLRQLKVLGIGLAKRRDQINSVATLTQEEQEAESLDAMTNMVEAALARDYPDVKLDDLEMTIQDLTKSYLDVLNFSGLLPKKIEQPGEAAAAVPA
jgi:hypothetical protein